MKSTSAGSARHLALAGVGLALALTQAGCGGHGGSTMTAPATPKLTTVARTVPEAPPGGPVTIGSPAFAEGAPIPVRYTCKGANTAPPLTWSAPLGAALVVDDPDAVGGTYVHWIVIGIQPGPGATAEGQTPVGGTGLPNSAGRPG